MEKAQISVPLVGIEPAASALFNSIESYMNSNGLL